MTRAQLTTILLYLRNAHAFTDSALGIAKAASDDEIAGRLAHLLGLHNEEILRIDDLRETLTATPTDK